MFYAGGSTSSGNNSMSFPPIGGGGLTGVLLGRVHISDNNSMTVPPIGGGLTGVMRGQGPRAAAIIACLFHQ